MKEESRLRRPFSGSKVGASVLPAFSTPRLVGRIKLLGLYGEVLIA